jgi:hypothetical protein
VLGRAEGWRRTPLPRRSADPIKQIGRSYFCYAEKDPIFLRLSKPSFGLWRCASRSLCLFISGEFHWHGSTCVAVLCPLAEVRTVIRCSASGCSNEPKSRLLLTLVILWCRGVWFFDVDIAAVPWLAVNVSIGMLLGLCARWV